MPSFRPNSPDRGGNTCYPLHPHHTHSLTDWTHLMRITRSLTIPALALALLAGGGTAAAINSGGTPVTPSPAERAAATTCQEDQACWDCETHGNQICGLPDIQANEAHRATAWDAWDRARGWTQLRVDPSREVRVDVIGYSLSPVPGELSLHGADGLWYVFDAR